MAEKKWYGFWSAEAVARGYGPISYEKTDGSIVEVTCIVEDPSGATYKWRDKVARGEVLIESAGRDRRYDRPTAPPQPEDDEVTDVELDCTDDP